MSLAGYFGRYCCGCVDDGMFVYASKTVYGAPGPEWNIAPEVYSTVYRKAVGVHTVETYWFNTGTLTWDNFATQTVTVTWEWHPILNVLKLFTVESTLNGLLYSKTLDESTGSTYTEWAKLFADMVYEDDPGGTPDDTDTLPATFTGEYEVLAVGTGTITTSTTDSDEYGVKFRMTSEITYSEPLNPTTIGAQVSEMLATVPLQRANQAVTNCYNDGDTEAATDGNVGFQSTAVSTYLGNLVTLYWYASTSGAQLRMTTGTVGTLDDIDNNPADTSVCVSSQNREQTWTPASRTTQMPGNPGGGSGTMVVTGVDAEGGVPWLPYAAYHGPLGDYVSFDIDYPTVVGAIGWAKKSLLARTESESWVVTYPYDALTTEYGYESGVCLSAGEVTQCNRFYYPADSDDGSGATPSSAEFTFDGDGIIYRQILVIPTASPPCPTGELPGDNPCL